MTGSSLLSFALGCQLRRFAHNAKKEHRFFAAYAPNMMTVTGSGCPAVYVYYRLRIHIADVGRKERDRERERERERMNDRI